MKWLSLHQLRGRKEAGQNQEVYRYGMEFMSEFIHRQESSLGSFVITEFLFSTIDPHTQSAGISQGILKFQLSEPTLYLIEGPTPPRQVGAVVGIDKDAAPIKWQLLLFTDEAKNLQLILKVQQLDQNVPWAGSAVLTENRGAMSRLDGRWSGEMLLTQKLRDQAGHEAEHIITFRGLRYSDKTEIGRPAPVLQVINFIHEVEILRFQ